MNTINTISRKPVFHFTFNHVNQTIDGSALNFQRAGIPASPLYSELMACMKDQPSYSLNPIAPEKQVKKQSYKGLNHQLMIDYLDALGTQVASDLRSELENMKENEESFASRKKIFLENFPGFNVNKAKMVIKDSNFEALKVKYKVVPHVKPETGSSAVAFKKVD